MATWWVPRTSSVTSARYRMGKCRILFQQVLYWPLCNQATALLVVPFLSTRVSLQHCFKSPKDLLFKAPSPLHGILRWHQVLWSFYLRDEANVHFAHPAPKSISLHLFDTFQEDACRCHQFPVTVDTSGRWMESSYKFTEWFLIQPSNFKSKRTIKE